MRTYWLLFWGLAAAMLALFGLASALEIPLLEDPRPVLDHAGQAGAAAIGASLLVADVLLPVPSSLVMIAHGALFGLVPGALVSLIGALGAAAFGFALGRGAGGRLERWLSPEERSRADRLLRRWGLLAVVVTRPVPILAESVAIFAGASPLRWPSFLLAALLGNLPSCLLYAATGATARRLDDVALIFGLVLAIAAATWWVGSRRAPAGEEGEAAGS